MIVKSLTQRGIPNSEAAGSINRIDNRPDKMVSRPRVLRVHNTESTYWDYETAPYVRFIREDVVSSMLKRGLCGFTGAATPGEAWRKIMPTYEKGDVIAVKPNLNALHLGYARNIDVTPTVINSVVGSLIEDLGVPSKNICVYDLCADAGLIRGILKYPVACVGRFTSSLYDRLKMHLQMGPNAFDSSAVINLRHPVHDKEGNPVFCYVPKVLTHADHLINIPAFKAHQFILTSSALKNHFGTVRFSNYSQYPVDLHGKGLQSHIVDINLNKHVIEKTRINIVDALFGAPLYGYNSYGRLPTPWQTFPKDKTPNSLIFSSDTVALESIVGDYIVKEQRHHNVESGPHHYLHLAAEAGLGVHEHRKDDGSYEIIDYREIEV